MNSDGSQLVKACGTTKPAVIKSSGNKMTVVFHSDGSEVAKGAVTTWVFLTPTSPHQAFRPHGRRWRQLRRSPRGWSPRRTTPRTTLPTRRCCLTSSTFIASFFFQGRDKDHSGHGQEDRADHRGPEHRELRHGLSLRPPQGPQLGLLPNEGTPPPPLPQRPHPYVQTVCGTLVKP